MTEFTRITNKFSYHTEDLSCLDCLYRINKIERKNKNTGCGEEVCRYEDIRRDAIANGRHKRLRGWFKLDM